MEDKALIDILTDMVRQKQKEARYLFISLVAVIIMNLCTIGAFLMYESSMETVTTTTTQEVSGDESDIVNGDQINGDQYNDESQNRSE